MATLFSHAVVAGAIGQGAPAKYRSNWKFWYLAVLCSILPDADVAGRWFGVAYDDLWGHRGITHSLFFAVLAGLLAAARLRPDWKRDGWKLAAILIAATASHGIIDAMTNGGRGIAFFAPFDSTRYFLPWRPIQVSPIGLRFFSARGLRVIGSELIWIWPAAIVAGGAIAWLRGRRSTSHRADSDQAA